MSWPADAVAGPRPGSMARRPCPDIVLSAPDDRDASQVNHAPRLDARRRRKGNAQASGGSAPQHSPAECLFKGPAGSPERPKHSPIRSISERPHSGPSPPPRRLRKQGRRRPGSRSPGPSPIRWSACSRWDYGSGNIGFRVSPHTSSRRKRISVAQWPVLAKSGAASRDNGSVLTARGAFQPTVASRHAQATRVLGRRRTMGLHETRKQEPKQGGAHVHLILSWPKQD